MSTDVRGVPTATADGDAARPGPPSRPPVTFRPPRPTDPRLHVAAVLLTVQLLGQVSLGFQLSIAQILVSLGTAGLIEALLTFRSSRVVAWPASALLSGNGVALILRVPGTEHGDWWSMRGWYVFAATAAVAVLSKYVIRWADRPLFNPSNAALVLTFLVLGATHADPQDLWWGPLSVGLVLTYAVITLGGVVITGRLGLRGVWMSFWGVFAALVGVLALSGHAMVARWHLGPVGGLDYWRTLALSPEILIFAFFMITDPRTSARGRTGRLLYGAGVGVASALLVSFQTTEYATKVALLTGLVLVCATRPLLERCSAASGDDPAPRTWLARPRHSTAVGAVAVVALVGVLVGSHVAGPPAGSSTAPATTARPSITLARDQRPSVELTAAARSVGGGIDRATADRLARGTVEALLLADRAVADGDRRLLSQVAAGPWLQSLRSAPRSPAPRRTVRTARIDVVRDPKDFQSVPTVAVTLTGTEAGAAWSATYQVTPVGRDVVVVRRRPD